MKRSQSRIIGLAIVTFGAAVVLLTVGAGLGAIGWEEESAQDGSSGSTVEIPKTPVSVIVAVPRAVEITDRYSGLIRPFERHSLGFELSGRLVSFGTNAAGEPLDEGDQVDAQQVLAHLDDTLLRAQLDEALANLEQSQSEYDRRVEIRDRGRALVTDAEFLQWVTQVKLTEARSRIARKNLENATLVSPVAGRISKRWVNVGQFVTLQQPVFEIIEVENVLLVVGVPESRVGEIRPGQKVHIELMARDRFGERVPSVGGDVYRVAEASDDATSLFEVEILLPNPRGFLKPGLIAVANIVVDTLEDGFELPMTSVVFRRREPLLFAVGEDGRAHEYRLTRWIEQGGSVILPDLPEAYRTIVVRGQHRLIEGREVELVNLDEDETRPLDTSVVVPSPNAGASP